MGVGAVKEIDNWHLSGCREDQRFVGSGREVSSGKYVTEAIVPLCANQGKEPLVPCRVAHPAIQRVNEPAA
jgi:hypothetical protein